MAAQGEVSPRPLGARIVGPDDRAAERNRARLDLNGVFALNLIGPPGAGKASLVRRTTEALTGRVRLAVVSTHAAPPAAGCPTVSVDAASAPHLTPDRLGHALSELRLRDLDVVIVENVGDFVCPATYRLGTHLNVRIGTPFDEEWDPLRHPQLFTGLDAMVLNKMDQVGATPFDTRVFRRALDHVNPNLVLMPVSCMTGAGIADWIAWLSRCRSTRVLSRRASGQAAAPPILNPRRASADGERLPRS
jgi:hydrogenase nickel incorporation protein HypB